MNDLKPADAERQHLGPPAPSPAGSQSAHLGWHSRGYLPHYDSAGLAQHIVFGLADALPPNARPPSALHADRLLDSHYGACLLRQDECAAIVQNALLQDDGERYRLLAWCIMPNHVHALVEQIEGARLSDVIQRLKSTTAHRINPMLGRKGRLWRREYFDRFTRDDNHLRTVIDYIEQNPVEAGLTTHATQWKWSSARHRTEPAGEGAGGPRP